MGNLVFLTLIFILVQCNVQLATHVCRLDLVNPTPAKYKRFIRNIRMEVQDPEISYGGTDLPVLGQPTNTFLRIDLILVTGTVSVVISRDDLYIHGYMAQNLQGEFFIYSFPHKIPTSQLKILFPEVPPQNYRAIRDYEEGYSSIAEKAGSRQDVGLGIKKLIDSATRINRNNRNVNEEARFLLLSVQLISEAARFCYIEDVVASRFNVGFDPSLKTYILISNWGKISKAIRDSKNGIFKKPLILDCNAFPRETLKVSGIKDIRMGILKYCGTNEGTGNKDRKNDQSNDEVQPKGPPTNSRTKHASAQDGISKAGFGDIARKDGGRSSGRSKCMCTFSTTLDVPSTPSTSPDILLISLLVVAIYGTATMTLFFLHEANDFCLRTQVEFTCPNDLLKVVYGNAIMMLFWLCAVLVRRVRIMVRFLLLNVRVMVEVLLLEFYSRRRQRIQEGSSWCQSPPFSGIQEGSSWCQSPPFLAAKMKMADSGGFQPVPKPPVLRVVRYPPGIGRSKDEDEDEDKDEEIGVFDSQV